MVSCRNPWACALCGLWNIEGLRAPSLSSVPSSTLMPHRYGIEDSSISRYTALAIAGPKCWPQYFRPNLWAKCLGLVEGAFVGALLWPKAGPNSQMIAAEMVQSLDRLRHAKASSGGSQAARWLRFICHMVKFKTAAKLTQIQ